MTHPVGVPLREVAAGIGHHDGSLLGQLLAGLAKFDPLPPGVIVHLARGYNGALARAPLDWHGFAGDLARHHVLVPIWADNRWVVERTHVRMNGPAGCVAAPSGEGGGPLPGPRGSLRRHPPAHRARPPTFPTADPTNYPPS